MAAPFEQTRRLLEITDTHEVFTVRDPVRAALSDAGAAPAE
ncbi:hypothetical protein ACFVUY_21485 [Kitasatospora sp. NPDC058063]